MLMKIIDLRPTGRSASMVDYTDASIAKEKIVTSIKEICYSGIFKHPTGNLASSIRGYVVGNTIYIISDVPYAKAVEEGVKPHVMWYLLNKTIPIRTFFFGQQRLIFRRATLKSYLRGGWRHPGTEGKHVFAQGIEQGIAESAEQIGDFDAQVRDVAT